MTSLPKLMIISTLCQAKAIRSIKLKCTLDLRDLMVYFHLSLFTLSFHLDFGQIKKRRKKKKKEKACSQLDDKEALSLLKRFYELI